MNVQVNDVRIGNLVYNDNTCCVCEVGIDDLIAIHNNQIRIVCDSGYDGIKITPEILTSSGFDARDASDEGYLGLTFTLIHMVNGKQDYFTLVKNGDSNEYEFEFYYDESSKIRPHRLICYVHELQNLYFALYGEELNIVL